MTVSSFEMVSLDLEMILLMTVSLSGASSLSSETRTSSFLAKVTSFFLKFLMRMLIAPCCSLIEPSIYLDCFCWILINSSCCLRRVSFSSARSNNFSVFYSLISLVSSWDFCSTAIVSLVLFDSRAVSFFSISVLHPDSSPLTFSISTWI